MKTYCIRHEVVITASPQATYLALTDIARLARWWTSDTRGDGASIGGVLEFRFGDFCQKFTVMALQAGEQVRWKAARKEGVDEWAGTEVEFTLSAKGRKCVVAFRHSGWRAESGMFPHCSTKWAVFLVSLKELLEKGAGHPYPDDVAIN